MPGLDLLRLVAGLALIVCHAGFLLAPFAIPDTVWMLVGHACVELFLVSYGFLLARQMLKSARPVPTGRMWARSLLRLWPLYALFLLCNFAMLPPDATMPSWFGYLTLTQNLAWPHPEFFGEAWIVAAALLVALVVPLLCQMVHQCRLAAGVLCLTGLLALAVCMRGVLVWGGDPSFDSGIRKILIARLDLPVYGVLAAWLWIRAHEIILRWRGTLALLALGLLAATAWIHLNVPLDRSLAARVLLFPLCDVAWLCLMPWVCSLPVPDAIARPAGVLAASAYAGLLTHVTTLRLLHAKGFPLVAAQHGSGIGMLASVGVLCVGVAVLISLTIDRALLDLRKRRLPRAVEHPMPITEGR